MRALLVLNEASRRGLREGDAVCRLLAGCGIECDRDPAARDVDAVIAAGGDGTVTSTVPIALERGVPLGIVPLGTFNDLARSLGVPPALDAACTTIAAAHTRRIDLGRVNGRYFVNEASVGLSVRIAGRQTPEVKQRFGVLGVIATTLAEIRDARPFHADVRFDGRIERLHTLQLTIANNGHFGGIFDRADASIDDGWLDLYSIDVQNWMQGLRVARKIIAKDPRSGDGLRTMRAAAFEIHAGRGHHISADGEPAGTTPARFEVLPLALDVIVPAATAG